jgi:iron complex transport system substrate-binding protein
MIKPLRFKSRPPIFWIGLGVIVTLWIICFYRPAHTTVASSESPSAPTRDCRWVEHSAGKTCAPKHPQRIITLDSITLEDAIALGVQPLASVSSSLDTPHLSQQTRTLIDVGTNGEPSLEKILALKPDLILGLDYLSSIYAQTSHISPTVLSTFNHSGEWKKIFMDFSTTLGRSQQAEAIMANYYQRLEDFKVQMGDRLQNTKVSIVYLYADLMTVYTTVGFNGSILKDAGLARPPAQDLDAEATQFRGNLSPIQYELSRELLDAADGDAIFLIVTPNDPDIGKTYQRLLADPLWSKLKAVQQGKVYEVLDYWIGSGPIAANLVIDDLFKYLLPAV